MNTIKLKSYLNVRNEFVASEYLYPGHAVQLRSDGRVEGVRTGSGPIFGIVVENELVGGGIGFNLWDSVPPGETALIWTPTRGDEGLVWLVNPTSSPITPTVGYNLSLRTSTALEQVGKFVATTAKDAMTAKVMTSSTSVGLGGTRLMHVMFT